MKICISIFFCTTVTALITGCSQGDAEKLDDEVVVDGSRYLLTEEPKEAKSVIQALEESKDGDEIVMVGRIGGPNPWNEKHAVFTLVDSSLKPCPQGEGCPTPWDY